MAGHELTCVETSCHTSPPATPAPSSCHTSLVSPYLHMHMPILRMHMHMPLLHMHMHMPLLLLHMHIPILPPIPTGAAAERILCLLSSRACVSGGKYALF